MKEEIRNKRKAGRKKDPYSAKPVSVPVPLIPLIKAVIKKFKDQAAINPSFLNQKQELNFDCINKLEYQSASCLDSISQALSEILKEFSWLREHLSKEKPISANNNPTNSLGDESDYLKNKKTENIE